MTYPSGRGLRKSLPYEVATVLPPGYLNPCHARLVNYYLDHSLSPLDLSHYLSPHRSPSLHLELRKWQWSIPANYRCPPWPLLSPLLSPTPPTFSYYIHYSPILSLYSPYTLLLSHLLSPYPHTLSYYLLYSLILSPTPPTISYYLPYSLLLSPLLSHTPHTIS